MYMDFSRLFHDSSKDLLGGGTVRIPTDSQNSPEEWQTAEYKDYPRFPKIPLPESRASADLFDHITQRSSKRDFSGTPVSAADLSTLLKYSCGITGEIPEENPRRAYPSGGARFPLEVYPIVLSGSEDVPAGLYHYNVREHALDVLWQRELPKEEIGRLFAYGFAQDASVALVITAVLDRSQRKYGERGYRYILLETGHMGQNIYLCSSALGLGCCGLGGTYDVNLEAYLDIDGKTESVVYALLLGA